MRSTLSAKANMRTQTATSFKNRLRNSFIQGINDQGRLPRFIVIVLDDDLLEYLGYGGQGVSTLLGNCIEWLCKEFDNLIKLAKNAAPAKSVRADYPQMYWVAPPHHRNFMNNSARSKLINILETTFKLFKDNRIIRMKEVWEYNNPDMVNNNGQYTDFGWDTYWRSVDAAIKFNVKKRELFLANQTRSKMSKFGDNSSTKNTNENATKRKSSTNRDDMYRFFKKHKKEANPNKKTRSPSPVSHELPRPRN